MRAHEEERVRWLVFPVVWALVAPPSLVSNGPPGLGTKFALLVCALAGRPSLGSHEHSLVWAPMGSLVWALMEAPRLESNGILADNGCLCLGHNVFAQPGP